MSSLAGHRECGRSLQRFSANRLEDTTGTHKTPPCRLGPCLRLSNTSRPGNAELCRSLLGSQTCSGLRFKWLLYVMMCAVPDGGRVVRAAGHRAQSDPGQRGAHVRHSGRELCRQVAAVAVAAPGQRPGGLACARAAPVVRVLTTFISALSILHFDIRQLSSGHNAQAHPGQCG